MFQEVILSIDRNQSYVMIENNTTLISMFFPILYQPSKVTSAGSLTTSVKLLCIRSLLGAEGGVGVAMQTPRPTATYGISIPAVRAQESATLDLF